MEQDKEVEKRKTKVEEERADFDGHGLRRFATISILTCGNDVCSGFANAGHEDVNDRLCPLLQGIGDYMLNHVQKYIEQCTYQDTRKLKMALKHVRRLRKNGLSSSFTTCGYKVFLNDKEKKKKAYVYFIYNSLGVAVLIPSHMGCYHTFGGFFGKHQTAVPVTFDGEYVRFNNDDLFVMAWGNGKSAARQYIEGQGVRFPQNHRITQRDIDNFFAGADRNEQEHLRNNNWV